MVLGGRSNRRGIAATPRPRTQIVRRGGVAATPRPRTHLVHIAATPRPRTRIVHRGDIVGLRIAATPRPRTRIVCGHSRRQNRRQRQVGLGVLVQLDPSTIALGACSVPLVLGYPLAKRFFFMPQLVLGCTFNWGAVLGYSAATGGAVDPAVCLPLYGGCVAWTLLYDTLYAHQDKSDDKKLGLRSSALTIGDEATPMFLRACGAAAVGGVAFAGYGAGLGADAWPFYAGVGGFAAHLAWQVETANLNDAANLGRRFRANGHVGPVVLSGIVAGTLMTGVT